MKKVAFAFALQVLAVALGLFPREGRAELNSTSVSVNLRGVNHTILVYRPRPEAIRQIVILASGDSGWHGFVDDLAHRAAAEGRAVYCLNSRAYLAAYTTPGVTTAQVGDDFAQLLSLAARREGPRLPAVFSGWSEGAGLALLAATDSKNKSRLDGVVLLGLSEKNILAWQWKDAIAWITRSFPNEPFFESRPYVRSVAPLPIAFLYSSQDEFCPPAAQAALTGAAREPKRVVTVNGRSHRFSGKQPDAMLQFVQMLDWTGNPHPRQEAARAVPTR